MTLYSKEILGRAKNLSSTKKPSFITHCYRVSNPICGDRVEWQIHIANQEIVEAWVETKGCALCKASPSLSLGGLIGYSVDQVYTRAENFLNDVDGILGGAPRTGEASLFEALPTAPARRECVVLPWQCLKKAVNQEG